MYGTRLRRLVSLRGKKDMSEMPKANSDYYLEEANKHADFLIDKVFKPAFVMAFVYGAKHGREDLAREIEARGILHLKKEQMKKELCKEMVKKKKKVVVKRVIAIPPEVQREFGGLG